MKHSIQEKSGLFRYGGKDIAFRYWTHNETAAPDTVIFLGAGQMGKIGAWVCSAAPTGTIAIEGAPHWVADPSGKDIEAFMASYCSQTLTAVLAAHGVSSVHVIAESQAGAAALRVAANHPSLVRNVALVGPLGFSAQALGDTPKQRLRAFVRRGVQSGIQAAQELLLPRSLFVHVVYIRAMLSEPSLRALSNKYAAGLSCDITADCLRVSHQQQRKGRAFSIVMGERDRLFPPAEILASLESAKVTGVTTIIVPRAFHSSFAMRNGNRLLQRALNAVHSG